MTRARSLPGLESSHINTAAEDDLYDTMMLSLLRILTEPFLRNPEAENASLGHQTGLLNAVDGCIDGWKVVSDPTLLLTENLVQQRIEGGGGWRNLMNWRAFVKKTRAKVLLRELLSKMACQGDIPTL